MQPRAAWAARGIGPAAAILAAAAGLAVSLAPGAAVVILGGLAAVLIVARWPTAVVAVLLIACQDVPRTGGFGAETTQLLPVLGEQLYSTVGGVPVLLVLLALTAAAGLLRAGPAAGLARAATAAAVVLFAGAVIVSISMLQGVAPLPAVNGFGRPYLEAAFALITVATTAHQPGGWRTVGIVSAATMIVLAVAAVAAVAVGAVDVSNDGSLLVFYDSATPAVAAAVALAGIATGRARTSWQWPLLVSALAIVVLSGRRNVWLAMLLALIVIAVVHRRRLTAAVRVAVAAGVLAVGGAVVAPAALTNAWDRLLVGVGPTTDASTTGHVDDIVVGWRYALERPFVGYGPTHPPLPGTVVQTDSIYVHNSYLLEWLRFGAPGLIVSVLCGVALLFLGARSLRSAHSLVDTAAAAFLLIAPLCALSAAFFTTTQHWPAAIGAAVGALIAARATRLDSGEALGHDSETAADALGDDDTGRAVGAALTRTL